MLLVENTLRPELASAFASQTRFDPEHLVAHSSPWSMAKQHYLAALSRRNGLRVKIAQLELACFNFSFGASNHFNIVFRLLPLMVCQLFPSQAERLNAADSLDLSGIGVPDPLPDWNPESEVSHWKLHFRFLMTEDCSPPMTSEASMSGLMTEDCSLPLTSEASISGLKIVHLQPL